MISIGKRLALALTLILFSTLLAGCFGLANANNGQPTATPAVTPISSGGNAPTTVAPTTVAPTTVAPTAVAPTAVSQPAPAKPVIDFQPRGGKADTAITVSGWGFAPNSRVAIRIGLPNPVGEVLASVQTNATGEWSTQVIIPGVLPSGDPITTSDMRIVAMNEQNQALASAPFAFEPIPLEGRPIYGFASSGEEAVRFLLDAILANPNGGDAFAYTSQELYAQYANGPAINLMQLQNPFGSYTLDGVVGADGQRLIFQVTLNNRAQKRLTAMPTDPSGALWVVAAIEHIPFDPNAPYPQPDYNLTAAEKIVRQYYAAMGADRAGEAWSLQTFELRQVITEESLASSGADVVSSEVTGVALTGSTYSTITFRVTVNLVLEPHAPGSLGGGLRDFSVTLRAEPAQGWLISEIIPL